MLNKRNDLLNKRNDLLNKRNDLLNKRYDLLNKRNDLLKPVTMLQNGNGFTSVSCAGIANQFSSGTISAHSPFAEFPKSLHLQLLLCFMHTLNSLVSVEAGTSFNIRKVQFHFNQGSV
jgi:hypothetical protein